MKRTASCGVCKVPVCRPLARGDDDLAPRDCWERHEKHGIPAWGKHWRGAWWSGYGDAKRLGKGLPVAKRRRATTGSIPGR